ncbi:MAG TPA: ABC transporter substrate-binding protein/permease, partial [Gemmataceae bacterium]|nr:ABC transporter substrate-binding protein/permease [Gemmataceae bacterium]
LDSRIGFEVDLADALSRELHRPIERKHASFEKLLDALNLGEADFAMNGLEITPENVRKARFTRPYYIYQLQLIARTDDDRFSTLKDCKERKLTVGALEGSAAARLLRDEEIAMKPFDKQDAAFDDLRDKAIDAVIMDVPIAVYYVIADSQIEHRRRQYTGQFKFVGTPIAEGFYGIAVKNDDAELAKELDAALGRVIQSGELKSILTKWHLWSPDQYRLYTPLKTAEASTLSLPFTTYLLVLVQAAGMTVFLTVAGMFLAVALGLPIAMARLYGPLPVRWLAIGYIEFFRGIPVLFLLIFLYYGLPNIIGIKLPAIVAAIVGFGLNYAAYEAEIYRGGIQSIPLGQWEAGASLGMSSLLTFRRIILPQSIRVILPPMTNDSIALFKDTSLVSVISVVELTKQYQILTNSYGGYLEIGLTTATLYLFMSVPLGYLSRHLEKRWGAK